MDDIINKKNTKISRAKLLSIVVLITILILLPIVLPSFRVNQLGRFLTFALLAVGLNILWGYTGILSLGQGLFFVLGGYCIALYLKLQTEPVPDFMQWSGIETLPALYAIFSHFMVAFPASLILPMVLAWVIGRIIFTSRISGVYFTIVSQALTLAFSILLVGQQAYTGGANGITNFKGFFEASIRKAPMIYSMYYVSLAVLMISLIFWYWFSKLRTGKIFVCIREKEDRLRFLGYNTINYKVASYVISAGFAGLAGALFVTQSGIISPSQAQILPSIETAIWVLIGGRGTILGPVAGAILVNYMKSFFSEVFPGFWLYFLGIILIACVLFFPKGIISHADSLFYRKKAAIKESREKRL